MGHQLAHGGLKVVVAHDSAGNTRGACTDPNLVDDEHITAIALTASPHGQSEVVGRAQPVHAGTDNQEFRALWEGLSHCLPEECPTCSGEVKSAGNDPRATSSSHATNERA